MKAVEITGLDVRYGAARILEEIAFSAEQGEMIGIVGPNGSGKTTLLKAMSRIVTPESGEIYYNNQDMADLTFRQLAREVAVVPQEIAIQFDYTVREIVTMGRHPFIGRFASESREDHAICTRAMKLASVDHLAETSVNAISGGERQRVLIARALAQEPKVLLLDEATSNLDISHQIEILSIIRRETVRASIISVFHDLNLASSYCDRILLLKDRQIHAMGPPAEVLTRENIRAVYGVDVIVRKHPLTGRPYILLMYDHERGDPQSRRIHILCGGGTGSELMQTLHAQGIQITTGVLNILDSDYLTAKELGIMVISEPPFSPISEESVSILKRCLTEADLVILLNMPIGRGNIENIRVLNEYKEKVVMYGMDTGIQDYSGGEATRLITDLWGCGALRVESLQEIQNFLSSKRFDEKNENSGVII